MGAGNLASTLHVVEVSEWLDWLRRELTLGGISLPEEETAVLFIEHALHLADRTQGVYRHLPDSLRQRLIKAAIVYQCWSLQKRLRKEGRRQESGKLKEIAAISYLAPLGTSGRHHLVEANDGFRYVVTLRSGLWTETMPATEIICNELARLLGLNVPSSAVLAVGPDLLRLADRNRLAHSSIRSRPSTEFCCGFRYVDASSASPDHDVGKKHRVQLVGALVFDVWVLNSRPRSYAICDNLATGRSELIFFDHSHCFMDGRWLDFREATAKTLPGAQFPLNDRDARHLEPWLRKIDNLDMHPLWELVFGMPAEWYGRDRAAVTLILGSLESRVWDLRMALHHWGKPAEPSVEKRPPRSARSRPHKGIALCGRP